ncbi:hypothetical protein KC949_03420 [Candidatus Saccharibacteria bacterium]|nr:hypothetical protein [Candidatus Saccharibacteria bacterium]
MKTTLVIFGITGDLSTRKLLPALANIIESGQVGDLSIIGVSRRAVEQFQVLGSHHERLGGTTSMFQMDLSAPSDYARLKEYIGVQPDEKVLFYLSVPPASMGEIIENLGNAGLNTPEYKLLIEKPFGTDLETAHAMVNHISGHFSEAQVYRIDHYLAKEMAQNIITFRARNAMFAQLWSKEHIEKIDVIALESISIEGRAAFYEQTGALRDIVQGHLLQLLALTILPLPEDDTFSWDSLPDRRLEALQWLQPADPSRSVHAQYDTYREEVGNPDSNVETFVSTLLESNDPNWKGVPMSLTTGKGLDKKKTEIRIHFRRMNMSQSNFLTFKLYPDEGIKIDLVTRKPGYDQEIENRSLSFSYATEARMPDAYEQVLVDAIKSRKSLFTCSGEVLRAWEIVAPLQKTWARQTDIQKYSMGSRARAVIGDLPTDELA